MSAGTCRYLRIIGFFALLLAFSVQVPVGLYAVPDRDSKEPTPTLPVTTYLKAPNMTELLAFLLTENLHQRLSSNATCFVYAVTLQIDAEKSGLNVSLVAAVFEVSYSATVIVSGGHAFNGVYLANGTHLWIEPQTGEVYGSLEALLQNLASHAVSVLGYVEVWPKH